jgi:hypothetical protein
MLMILAQDIAPPHQGYQTIQIGALVCGLVFGAVAITSASGVWIWKREFGLAGSILTGAGMILISLSIWRTAVLSVSADGAWELKFEALAEKLRLETDNVVTALRKASQEQRHLLVGLESEIRENQNRVSSATEDLIKLLDKSEETASHNLDFAAFRDSRPSLSVVQDPEGRWMLVPNPPVTIDSGDVLKEFLELHLKSSEKTESETTGSPDTR